MANCSMPQRLITPTSSYNAHPTSCMSLLGAKSSSVRERAGSPSLISTLLKSAARPADHHHRHHRVVRINARVPHPSVLAPSIDKKNGTVTKQQDSTAVTPKEVSRQDFPADFVFGAGVSSFQAEGAPHKGGRGGTIWDSFVHIPGKIQGGSVNYPGCDFFHLYEDDIKRAKDMGFTSFRFSISWTRIYPNGGQPGEVESIEGVQYYNALINTIVRAGMTPLVTLFHWETPQYLENDPEVLGFRTKNIVPYVVKLADTCFKHYGDRVKHWATFNEMWTFCVRGYAYGDMAPGRCSSVSGRTCAAGDSQSECYLAGHNMLLAHAKVYQLYKNKYKPHHHGVCGFNPCHFGAAPYSDKMEDKKATERYLEFFSGWQIDPVVFGDYPKSMRDALGDRLPRFTAEESEELKNSCDFLGHNYYSAYFIRNAEVPADPSLRWYDVDGGYKTEYYNDKGEEIGEQMGAPGTWVRNCAKHLPPLLEWMEKRYGNIPCYITENGCMDKNPDNAEESLADEQRVQYIRDHLTELSKAISEKGINVIGYYYWSFMDVFEWDGGHESRLGLIRVDIGSHPPTRTNKTSGDWFQKFLTTSSSTKS